MSTRNDNSIVWSFFKKKNNDKEVECKCGQCYKFSNSTSGMIAHIRARHSVELSDMENSKNSKSRLLSKTPTSYSEANDAFVLALCTSNVPFRFVKNNFFKKFCHILDPNYKMMSPDAIRRKLEENVRQYEKRVRRDLQNMTRCFVSVDGWDAISEISSIAKVLTKVNKLAAHLSRSKSDRAAFRERSAALKIRGRIPLPFCITRWGGCCILAQDYLTHYQSISSLTNFQGFLLDSVERQTLENFVKFTGPFVESIAQAETDSSFVSSLLVQFASLQHFIQAEDQRNPLVRLLATETVERFIGYLENEVCLLSTFADPRYAYMNGVLGKMKWEDVEKIVENYCDSSRAPPQHTNSDTPPMKKKKISDSNFLRFVESQTESVDTGTTKTEIVEYEALIRSARPPIHSCPLMFWLTHSTRFPQLSRLANHFLSIPLSSAQVERLFSRCGKLMSSSRRNRLSSLTMNDMLLNAALGQMTLDDDEKLKNVPFDEKESENESESEGENETGDEIENISQNGLNNVAIVSSKEPNITEQAAVTVGTTAVEQ